jgi:serine O-acetyltransferase
MQLEARSIGNDVQIRHDTTLGAVRVRDSHPQQWPIIEDRVELGAGVSVLGPVRVGHDAFVGANSLVLKNVGPNATVLGVPARVLPS